MHHSVSENFVFLIPIIAILMVPIMIFVSNRGKIKLEEMKAVNNRIEGLNNQGFEELIQEIRTENANLKSELGEIKEVLASIEKMMKEIE